ncbi:MAG TPA: ThiF family adenylyltransferase, partial [Pseudonocardiaceae bacterium]|nr:ThiF family adenylyltransferase [Pseudonocardiaceae bacterium]
MSLSTEPPLPERLRLAPGRVALWRSPTALQLGLDPQRAMVLDDLPDPLAALLRRMDGVRSTAELLAEAQAAGSPPGVGAAMLTDLHRAGLVQDAAAADNGPPGWHRKALAAEVAGWSAHTTRAAREVLRRRHAAAVRVVGSGRVAVALATTLAAAGIGRIAVQATGTVGAGDLGTGYLPDDLGRPRAAAARDAVLRAAPDVHVRDAHRPDLVVITDVVVPDPTVVSDLTATRIPHLMAYALEGKAAVGPLVWPGRSSCLRCAEFHRADADPAWPKLAAQMVGRIPVADLAATLLVAAWTAEQALTVLAGPGAG